MVNYKLEIFMKLGQALIALSLASTLGACSSSSNSEANLNAPIESDTISLGVLFGFSGPIQSTTPAMAAAAELAIAEVSDSGKLLGGTLVTPIRADSTCTDEAIAIEAFEQLLLDNVSGVVGADCSGITMSILNDVAVSAGMVMVSPSATSPALSSIDDNGVFFRTAPSDARQGVVLSQVMLERNIQSAAVTYTNNSYGVGFHDAFKAAYESSGGAITLSAAHEDGQTSYATHVSALASAGGDALVVLGYSDQGGAAIIQESVITNAFVQYALGDGMVSDALLASVSGLTGSFGIAPGLGADSQESETFSLIADSFDVGSPYASESYDAAALILLAMQAAESTDPNFYKEKVFDVANAPGEKIYSGELGKALDLLAAGTAIDYVGASRIELIEPGDNAGSYEEYEIQDDAFVSVRVRDGQPSVISSTE